MNFSELALHERLLKAIETLGFSEATPVQQEAIPAALQGSDLRVMAQTGSGKTAAFVLPMLHHLLQDAKPRTATRALILLPTRELAQQTLKQVELLAQFTFIKAALITGGEDYKKQAASLRKNPDIVIGTPGRLLEQRNAGNLELQDLEILVLDEADRMLDMGFSEDVLQLIEASNAERQTLLFSATSNGALFDLAAKVMREPQVLRLNPVSQMNSATVQQVVPADDAKHKEKIALWLLANEPYEKAIIFTNTRDQANRLGGVLIAAHKAGNSTAKVFVLHGDKDHKDRKQAVSRLNQGHINVLVATDVASRGLDIEGMDLVINFDMSRRGDDYVHRAGRTGRAGNAGLVVSLITAQEWNLMVSIERYLKQVFERRIIKEMKGSFLGPKKLKASGKAVGSKKKKPDKKKTDSKTADKKATEKKSSASKKSAPKKPSAAKPKPAPNAAESKPRDGSAPLRRKSV
ncbi:MAG: DEAD/DEAH box helicase [Pseudomonadales bacterium]